LAFSHFSLSAQIVTKTPMASPQAKVMQTIGMTNVKITYHRPAVNEREIWGKLVPYNAIWRAGANDNTTISFTDDVNIEGKTLKAGKYGLHMIPSETEWTIIFSHNSTAWGSFSYNKKEDALRVNVKPEKNSSFFERLTYDFEDLKEGTGSCVLKWEYIKVPIKIETDVHTAVVAQFRKDLQHKAGWTWRGWNEAAAYCLQQDINHEEALQWASRSVFMEPNANNMATKAKLTGLVKGKGDKEKQAGYAVKSMEKDLSLMPCTWKEWNAASKFALKHGQKEKAIKWAEMSVEMNPNMTNLMAQSQLFEKLRDQKKANAIRKDAISRGSNAELNNFGYQLLLAGKTDEAVEIFEANAEKNPEDPNVWDSLGEGYFNAGQKEKSIKALKKSLSLDPPDNVRANSMKLLQQMGVELKKSRT